MRERYLKNVNTGRIVPYFGELEKESHFVECTAEGVKIGKEPEELGNLNDLVLSQEKTIERLRAEVATLRAKQAKNDLAEVILVNNAPNADLRSDLEKLNRSDLVDAAKEVGIEHAAQRYRKGKEGDLIEAIIAINTSKPE